MDKVIQRALSVWKPDFLKNLLSSEEKSQKTTWLFWFLSAAIAAVIWALISVSWVSTTAIPALTEVTNEYIPDGATVSMSEGRLSTQNIEPFEQEYDMGSEGTMLVVIDTLGTTDVTSQTLEEYRNGILVFEDRFYIKDGSEINTEKFDDIPNFTYTKDKLMTVINSNTGKISMIIGVVMFFLMLSVLAVSRLLTAVWWTGLYMIFGRLFGLHVRWGQMYYVVLNLYFIPLVIEGVLMLIGTVVAIQIPFITTLIFAVLFALNISEWKKSKGNIADTGVETKSIDPEEPQEIKTVK